MTESLSFAPHSTFLSVVLSSGPVVQVVLIILVLLSVWTWAVAVSKILQLNKARRTSEEFSRLFWETRDLERVDDTAQRLKASPLAKIFSAGYRELAKAARRKQEKDTGALGRNIELEMIEGALRRAEHDEGIKLDSGTTFLATVASSAPFIGLFGTVWGIMTAFRGLSSAKSATIQAVAPGISEALIATAIGLAAAIPAAIAYNYFATSIRNLKVLMNRFSSEFVNLAKQYI